MPAFALEYTTDWLMGVVQSGPADMLPPGALRVGQNVRIDRQRGVLTNRPGITVLTTAAIDAAYLTGVWLSKIHGASASYGYAQVSNGALSRLYRTDGDWGAKALIASDLPLTKISDATWKDGKDHSFKYMVGPLSRKDDGTTLSNFGIAAPSEAPSIVGIGNRERISISAMEDHTDWGFNEGVTGKGNDGDLKQEGTNSMSVSIAPNTLGTVAIGFEAGNAHVSGTHTGSANSAFLVDGTKNFVTLGVRRGARVRNDTDGCEGTVTRFGSTGNPNDTLFFDAGLSGGSDNDFDASDAYEIYFNLDTFGIEFAAGTDDGLTDNRTDRVIDFGTDFESLNVAPGMRVWNTANGTSGLVSSIATTEHPTLAFAEHNTLICAAGFSGATENDFDAGDGFVVHNELDREDDWVFLWVRSDFPKFVEFVQVDFDTVVSDPNAASAFSNDYYTLQLPGSVFLEQGRDQWTELYMRKSDFRAVGEPDWRQVRACRLSAQMSRLGGGTLWFDDLSLIGGYGLEGEYEYTAVYKNIDTGCRSSPPRVGDDAVLWTQRLEVKRHAIDVSFGNINNPADTQIGTIALYRKGGNLPVTPDSPYGAYLVDNIVDSTVVYRDRLSDTLLLSREPLEIDNDPPPANAVVLFGPGPYNRLFCIYDRNKVGISKEWEKDESRAENWAPDAFFLVGDGNHEALNGIVLDATGFVYTEDATWAFTGRGPDTFLPVPVPESRGLAARWALTHGDGQIFLLSQDGLYTQRGITQQKLTGHLNKFFLGETVDGQVGLNPNRIGECELQWYAHPHGQMLVLCYPENVPDGEVKRLVLKKNAQSGQYTDAFFDDSADAQVLVPHLDDPAGHLLALTNTGHVVRLEDDSVDADDGTAIAVAVRTRAYAQPSVRHPKTYNDVIVEANTSGQTLAVTALLDRAERSVSLGSMASTSDAAQETFDALAEITGRDIALEFTASVTSRLTIFGYGWHASAEAEEVTRLDSDVMSFPRVHSLKEIRFDVKAPANVRVRIYVDGAVRDDREFLATAGQQLVRHFVPDSIKGYNFRIVATSASPFQVYGAVGWWHQWGAPARPVQRSLVGQEAA